MKHILYVNGTSSSQLWSFGCSCRRCQDFSSHRANTSVSLLSFDDQDRLVHHILFDVGDGVADSLVRNHWLRPPATRLDLICLSHWHPDHSLHLNRVSTAVRSARKRLNLDLPERIPIWCREGSAEWLRALHEFELTRYLELHTSSEAELTGSILSPILLPSHLGLSIRPISLSHRTADISVDRSRWAPATCGFVIETVTEKAVLLWDFDNQNRWLVNPVTPEQKATVKLMENADYLFVSTPWWARREDGKGHCSFEEGAEIADRIKSRETLLMHISGHEAGVGKGAWGWSDEEWTANARRYFLEHDIAGDVRVPFIGETFVLNAFESPRLKPGAKL